MYLEHFGLKENPFSIAPDPQYFFLSEGHQEAVAHLLYGVESDGAFILLTGEVGTGKTTTFRYFLDLLPKDVEIAFILNPRLKVEELLEGIVKEFRIPLPDGERSNGQYVSAIYDYLLETTEKGRRAILVVEEAQNLSPEVLEQIRLLTNLETRQRKLLQIILIGQPELRDLLEQPSLRQLNQRITARYHLGPLSPEETCAYVRHRLAVAGAPRDLIFPPKTLKRIYSISGGIPRLINLLCDRALLGAYVQEKTRVDPKTLKTAAQEVFGRGASVKKKIRLTIPRLLIGLFLLLVFFAVPVFYFYFEKGRLAFNGLRKSPPIPTRAVRVQPPAPLPTLEKPPSLTSEETRLRAFWALADRWGIPFHPASANSVCQDIQAFGLTCLKGIGGLTDLKQLNKPAVLTLRNEQGETYFAAILSLEDNRAAFFVGEGIRRVGLEEMATKWLGEFTLFWKPPPGYGEKGRSNPSAALTAWLDQKLAQVHPRPREGGERVSLSTDRDRALRAFQIAAGLIPDGIPGPRTLMALAETTGEGGPTLKERSGRP